MSTEETIVYGVIAGIVTSFVIFLVMQIFKKIIAPWYRSFIYHGMNVSGSWEETTEHDGATDICVLVLKQNAQSINGLMTVVKLDKDTNETEIKNFNLSGVFQDGHLALQGKNNDIKHRGHVTYLLQVAQGGISLKGICCWLDSGTDEIASIQTTFFRNNA